MRNVTRLGGAALLAGALAACDEEPTTPGAGDTAEGIVQWVDAPGVAMSAGSGEREVLAQESGDAGTRYGRIEAPDTVEAGESFEAIFATIGANGCWEADGIDVDVEGLAAEAVAFDRIPEEDGACTQALQELPRTATLTFEEPGEATIRLEGRRVEGIDPGHAGEADVEVTVTVVAAGSAATPSSAAYAE